MGQTGGVDLKRLEMIKGIAEKHGCMSNPNGTEPSNLARSVLETLEFGGNSNTSKNCNKGRDDHLVIRRDKSSSGSHQYGAGRPQGKDYEYDYRGDGPLSSPPIAVEQPQHPSPEMLEGVSYRSV